jgi:hypothetical protein
VYEARGAANGVEGVGFDGHGLSFVGWHLTIGSNDHAAHLRRGNREVDGGDKAASIDDTATARRSSSSLGPMIHRLGKVLLCFLVALAMGVVSSVLVDAARSPDSWANPYGFWNHVLIDAVVIVAAPLCVLALLATFRPTLSTSLAVLVAVGWLTIYFAWSAYESWTTYGHVYWSELWWHYLSLLPISLSFGLTFGICARTSLGPNNRLERSRAASSVRQGGNR